MKYLLVLLILPFVVNATDDMDTYFSMSPAELAEISVSIASGTAKSVASSAAVTSVVTAEQIKHMGATHLNQVLATIPGLHVSIQAVTNDAIYSMRGIRNDINTQVLVMLNGTRYTVPYKGSALTGLELPVEAIAKIEVIRGPGSALYGADAFAGVINIITKKAEDIDGTELGVRVGNHDTQSTWGLYGGQQWGWDIAASFQYQHNNEDEDRIISGDFQSQLDTALGTRASLAPSPIQNQRENWNAHMNLQRQHWQLGFWAYGNRNAGLRAGTAGAIDKQGELNSTQYLADLRYSTEDLFEHWQFQTNASYLYTDLETELHLFPDNSLLPINATGLIDPTSPVNTVFFPDGALTNLGITNQVIDIKTSSLYSGFIGHLIRIQAGFRYEQVRASEQRNFGIGILNGTETLVDGTLTDINSNRLIILPDSHRTIGSLALQDEWQINPDWQLTTGLRFDYYSDFGSTINPRVALVWEVNPHLTTKILYGRAFRAPSFLEQKQQHSQLFNGNPNIEPETIQTVEWALDYRPFQQLNTAINIYYYEIDDPIESNTASTRAITIVNGKGQEGYGAELEWHWKPHSQWLFKGNYAWQYARNQATHRRVALVPEHQFYVAGEWAFLPQWQLQTQLKWIGHRVNYQGDKRPLKAYETVDMTLTNRQRLWGYLDITASVHNVFDSNGREPALGFYAEHFPIASRSYYLEAAIHF